MELRSGLRLPDDTLPSPPAGGAAALMAPAVDIPPSPPVGGGVVMDPDTYVGANVSSDAVVPPPPLVGGGDTSPPVPSGAGAFFLPPVVLRVLPLSERAARARGNQGQAVQYLPIYLQKWRERKMEETESGFLIPHT